MSTKRTHKQRAIDVLQAYGWRVADVEAFIFRGPDKFPMRRDMWNLWDLLAINRSDPMGTLALQVTSPSHVAAHVKKMLDQRGALAECLMVGWRCELWGVRDAQAEDGSPMLARTFTINADKTPAVRDGSALFPNWG